MFKCDISIVILTCFRNESIRYRVTPKLLVLKMPWNMFWLTFGQGAGTKLTPCHENDWCGEIASRREPTLCWGHRTRTTSWSEPRRPGRRGRWRKYGVRSGEPRWYSNGYALVWSKILFQKRLAVVLRSRSFFDKLQFFSPAPLKIVQCTHTKWGFPLF